MDRFIEELDIEVQSVGELVLAFNRDDLKALEGMKQTGLISAFAA